MLALRLLRYEDIPGAIFLEYTAFELIQSVAAAILARTGTAQDFCSLLESVSALIISRAFSLYRARSSGLYSSPRADLTYLPSPLNRFTQK
ncbi:unnamed protein product [Prunus armeniaca]